MWKDEPAVRFPKTWYDWAAAVTPASYQSRTEALKLMRNPKLVWLFSPFLIFGLALPLWLKG